MIKLAVTASCKFPLLKEWKEICDKNAGCEIVDSVISGYAQIAFNDNTFSGLLMIAATAVASPVQAISGVWATLVATLVAYGIGVPKGLIRCGLYGFNAALVGVAIPVAVFPGQGVTAALLLYSALGGIISVFLMTALSNFFAKWNVSCLSLPYCVTLFVLVPASVLISTLNVSRAAPMVMEMAQAQAGWTPGEFMTATFNGIAQVLWVEKPIAGVLYVVAVVLASRMDALSSLVGGVVGTGVAIALGLPKDAIMIGLYGYNAVLLMKVITRGFALNARSYVLAVVLAGATSLVAAGLKVVLTPLGMNTFAALPYALICVLVFLGRDKFKGLTYIPAKNWGVPETLNSDLKEGKLDLT